MAKTSRGTKRSGNTPKVSSIQAEVEKILDWHPLPVNAPKKTTPTTRIPAPYDRHLDENLRLKRVVFADSIIQDIMAVADDHIRHRKLPSVGDVESQFRDVEDIRSADDERRRDESLGETGIVDRYALTIVDPLIRIASTVALNLPHWKKDFFSWSSKAQTQDFAIGDGFFRVSPQSTKGSSPLPNKTTRVLTAMQEWFPNIGVWEFKSVFAGSEKRMNDIIAFAKEGIDFPWVTCSEAAKDCNSHYQSDGGESVTGARMGYDATRPICKLPEKHKIRTIRRDCEYHLSVVYILQQIWAEAVREDATFIVLHSGDHEMIFYRDRETNILFVSGIIYVSKQIGYGRIQVGLYLSMYFDAFDRTSKILNAMSSGIKLPDSWHRRYNTFTYEEKEAMKSKKKPKTKMSLAALMSLQREIAQDARTLPTAVLEMKRRDNFFCISRPTRFYRLDYTVNDDIPRMRVIVGEFIDRFVYHAEVKINSKNLDKELVIKMAGNKEDMLRLLQEFRTYQHLSSRMDGMADIYGCFISRPLNPEAEMVVLVMKHHGYSLSSQKFAENHLNVKDRMRFMTMLHKIHEQGYFHNDLTRDKLLFDFDSVKIVGFGRSEQVIGLSGRKSQREDFHTLQHILNNAEMERVEAVEGNRPSKRARWDIAPTITVVRWVFAILIGPMELGDMEFYLGEIPVWMKNDPSFPTGTVCRKDRFIYMEFSSREGGAYFRKVWESGNRLRIPLQHWEFRDHF